MEFSNAVEISKLFIPVIAIVGVYIAFQQNRMNKEKFKYEIFDKRYRIYQSINLVVESSAWGQEIKQEDYRNFFQACDESVFLFPENVEKLVSEIRDNIRNKRRIDHQLGRASVDQDKREKLYEEEDQAFEKFEKYRKNLIEVFKPYLKIYDV